MGFSEFQRLSKRLSSRLVGVSEEDFDHDDNDESVQEEDGKVSETSDAMGSDVPEEEELLVYVDVNEEQMRRRAASQKARARWKGGIQKILMMNRFLAGVERSERLATWIDAFLRRFSHTLLFRIISAPFEILYQRSALEMPLFPTPWTRILVIDAIPGLAFRLAVEQVVNRVPFPGQKRQSILSKVLQLGLGIVTLYPFEVAFQRKVILNQPFYVSLGALSSASFNGLSSHAVHEVLEISAGIWDKSWSDSDSVAVPVAIEFVRFVLSVPVSLVRERIVTSNPEGTHPAPVSAIAECKTIYSEGGWRGFFTGFKLQLALVPPMIAVLGLGHLFFRLVAGTSRRERFQEQVESVRETLELKIKKPIVTKDRKHLETIVEMAAKRRRLLMLLVANDSAESESAEQMCHRFAETIDMTFVVGQTSRLPFLRGLVTDARMPFFIPIWNGTVELSKIIIYNRDNVKKVRKALESSMFEFAMKEE